MNIIKISDIDLNNLEKIKDQGTKGTIYKYENKCIKMLDGLYPTEKLILYYKFLSMEGIKIDGLLIPNDLIIDNNNLCGYTMDFFDCSESLNSYLTKSRFINCNEVFKIVQEVCKILKNVHKNEIIYQDLSFDNILINREKKIMFCDIDGCKYKNYNAPFVSILLNRLICDYRNEDINVSKNLDKVSIFISFLYSIYLKEIQFLTESDYNILANSILPLDNMKKYVDILLDKNKMIPNIPYVDELLNYSTNYIIDRNLLIK